MIIAPEIEDFTKTAEFLALTKLLAEGRSVKSMDYSKVKAATQAPKVDPVEAPAAPTFRFLTKDVIRLIQAKGEMPLFRDDNYRSIPEEFTSVYSNQSIGNSINVLTNMNNLVKDYPHLFSSRDIEFRGRQYRMFFSEIETLDDYLQLNHRSLDCTVLRTALFMKGAIIDISSTRSIQLHVLPNIHAFDILNNPWIHLTRKASNARTNYVRMEEGVTLHAWLDLSGEMVFSSETCINPEESDIAQSILRQEPAMHSKIRDTIGSNYSMSFKLATPEQDNIIETPKPKMYFMGYSQRSTGLYIGAPCLLDSGDSNTWKNFMRKNYLVKELNEHDDNLTGVKGQILTLENGTAVKIYTEAYYNKMKERDF
jgi:hypothetical protein